MNELCGAVVDGTLTDAQHARLSALLGESEAARRFYVRAMGQSAALHEYAAETHSEPPDRVLTPAVAVWRSRVWTTLAAAAAIAFAFWSIGRPPAAPDAPRTVGRSEFVARLTGAKELTWAAGTPALQPGAHLRRGQRLELQGGFAEITFDSGARVVVEGVASLDVNSAWDATLRRGTLKATVPPEAVGFRVSNPMVDVVDLGTEFTMIADGSGAAEVLVLKGEVEAAPRVAPEQNPILLREKESRRFAPSGVSEIADSEKKFALFAQPLALDRFSPGINYVHWPLDEAQGDAAQAEVAGVDMHAADAGLTIADAAQPTVAHTEGRYGGALHFDGQLYARAKVPGMSGSSPRTVAFWVRVPDDAQPADTWMVAWGTKLRSLGYRPVQISWNRRPGEGALGALRADFGGGHAVGTTSLRDGKWHHVAVYFAMGDGRDGVPQVKLYVDGRLESSAIVPGTVRAPGGTGDMAVTDVVWLGYRLTGKMEGRRFRGDLDELFIADRALEPNEIVALMRDNRPPNTTVASAR
ncbi:MAG TPA: LamG-like jellyroll fold domain-containing protein [Opitutaceae bacterium]|nr:LamG-like jellyroll fold domain-containing protein [Opitutaceae bacterium]